MESTLTGLPQMKILQKHSIRSVSGNTGIWKGNIIVQAKAQRKVDVINTTVTLKNDTENKVSFYYQPSKLYDFVLLDENKNEIFRWSEGRMFTMIVMMLDLEPGQIKDFNLILTNNEVDKQTMDKAKYFKIEIPKTLGGVDVVAPNEVEITQAN